eukprot:934286_1
MDTETETTNDITTTNGDDEKKWYMNWKTWLKIIIVVILLTFLVLAIIFNKTTGKILTGFLEWMKDNAVIGSFAFIGLYWFCTVMFIPGSLLTVGAGLVFGLIVGPWGGVFLATVIVFAGASLGASSAFLLGRFVLRDKVASYKSKYEKFAIIDKVVEEQGLKVTILLRLSPVIPFSAFNYFMGLTGVSFRDYNIAHFGMIPGTLAFCFIGTTLGAIGDSVGLTDNPVVLAVTIVGTIFAIIGMIYLSYVAKKEFAKIAERQKQAEQDADIENENTETGKINDNENNNKLPTYGDNDNENQENE